jgi:hypothetical protein
MAAAPGIAGSERPEINGCHLCGSFDEAGWFAEVVNNTIGPVDVWEVDAHGLKLTHMPEGWSYCPGAIPLSRLRLRLIDRDRQRLS